MKYCTSLENVEKKKQTRKRNIQKRSKKRSINMWSDLWKIGSLGWSDAVSSSYELQGLLLLIFVALGSILTLLARNG